MNKFKLGRLYLDNFKSFKNPLLFDFRDKDLLLFDGPNGYGKTTIFDALELCFRGEINRFVQLDTKKKDQHPLKNDSTKETTIFLELQDYNNSYFIYVSIEANPPVDYCKKAMISNRVLLTDYQKMGDVDNAETFKEKLSALNATEISDVEAFLKENLDYKNLQGTFNIFNYIQQEETTHFLKTKEEERHKAISHLFGIGIQQEELESIRKKLGEISDIINTKNDEKNKLETELGELQSLSETELGVIQSSQKIAQIMRVKVEYDA